MPGIKILIIALCVFAPQAAHADPIIYDITFIETQGIAATGVFIYDESVPEFSDLSVTWGVNTFDDLVYFDGGLCGTGAAGMFALLTRNCSANNYFWDASDQFGPARFEFGVFVSADQSFFSQSDLFTDIDQATSGGEDWTITARAAAVPEVPTLPLFAIGLLSLGLAVRSTVGTV